MKLQSKDGTRNRSKSGETAAGGDDGEKQHDPEYWSAHIDAAEFKVPAMYVQGDYKSDNGNNNSIKKQ